MMNVTKEKTEENINFSENDTNTKNKEKQENKLLKTFEAHNATFIFILTSIATLIGIIIKALERVYQHAKFKELGIPTRFMNEAISVSDFFPFLFTVVSFSISIIVLILGISHYRQMQAFFVFEKKLKINLKRKIEHIAIKVLYPVLGFIIISAINYTSVFVYINLNSSIMIVSSLIIVFLFEIYAAKVFLNMTSDYRKVQAESTKIKIEKPKDMTNEEFEEAKQKYRNSESIVNYKVLLIIISILLILSFLFVFTSHIGKSSSRYNPQQIVTVDDKTMVVLEMYNNEYIVSPATIGENNTLLIYNTNQTLIDSQGVNYIYMTFDNVILETD